MNELAMWLEYELAVLRLYWMRFKIRVAMKLMATSIRIYESVISPDDER